MNSCFKSTNRLAFNMDVVRLRGNAIDHENNPAIGYNPSIVLDVYLGNKMKKAKEKHTNKNQAMNKLNCKFQAVSGISM